MSAMFSPRVILPSPTASTSSNSHNNLLHRPWELGSMPPLSGASWSSSSSDSINSASSPSSSKFFAAGGAGSSFPFVSQSAPATPSGLSQSSNTMILPQLLGFPRSSEGNNHQQQQQQNHLLHHQLESLLLPSSPNLLHHHPPLGSPFSPYAPWSAPFSIQSFPLPSMPFNADNLTAPPTRFDAGKSINAGNGVNRKTTTAATTTPPAVQQQQKTSPPKKKRNKPPPIQIDSSISNFSADVAHLHGRAHNPFHQIHSAGAMLSPSMLNGGAYPLMSPLTGHGRGALSLPPPSPLAKFHHIYQQPFPVDGGHQQQMPNPISGYMFDGSLTPLPSSGYGSVESQMFWHNPSASSPALSFAFLCFMPGTKLKLIAGNDDNSKCDWQLAESIRNDNLQVDFGQSFRVVSYIKQEHPSDANPIISVELTLKPVDMPDNFGVTVKALCSSFHPFYDRNKGWCSLDPQATQSIFGLVPCHTLRVSDVIAVNPPFERQESALWTSMDANVNNILADWAARNRNALSLDSPILGRDNRSWTQSHRLPSSPITPREGKVKIKKEKKEKKDDKAKRPMNAFMLFAQVHRMKYTQLYPGRDNRAISCRLGEDWKCLAPENRQQYTDAAKKLAQEYKEKNPDCWKRRSRSRSDSDLLLNNGNHELLEHPSMVGRNHSPMDDYDDSNHQAIDLAIDRRHASSRNNVFDADEESDENALLNIMARGDYYSVEDDEKISQEDQRKKPDSEKERKLLPGKQF